MPFSRLCSLNVSLLFGFGVDEVASRLEVVEGDSTKNVYLRDRTAPPVTNSVFFFVVGLLHSSLPLNPITNIN
ncbi:hypothetical protein RIF29_41738 [Crotalaria pallida]|uniref:Uncharacterized protein n=1 Tax=Crotalaria pallida TaxID=3830 RepID=A0AAN9E5P0_CROPI